MKKYHKDVYMPSRYANIPKRSIQPLWDAHVCKTATDRGIEVPATLEFSGDNIFAVVTKNGKAYELNVRVEYDDFDDLCFVLRQVPQGITLITVWLNSVDDNHATLDETPYETGE